MTNWEADKIKLKEFQSMLEDFFRKEGVDPRLIEVTMPYLTFVCEISFNDVAALKGMVAVPAKRNCLCRLGIRSIELESDGESIPVSLLDGIGI